MCVLHHLELGDEVVVAFQEDLVLVGVVLRGDRLDLALHGDSLLVVHVSELVEDQVEQFALFHQVGECEDAHGGGHGGRHDVQGDAQLFVHVPSPLEDEELRGDVVHLVVGMLSLRLLHDEGQGVHAYLPSPVDDVLAVDALTRQRVEDLVVGGVGIQEDDVFILLLEGDVGLHDQSGHQVVLEVFRWSGVGPHDLVDLPDVEIGDGAVEDSTRKAKSTHLGRILENVW